MDLLIGEIWDKYNAGEINDKIKYWVDLWDDLITNFPQKPDGLQLVNPQLIIHDIIDEIEFNKFQNDDNRKFYYRQLDNIIKQDLVIKKKFKVNLDLIRRNFNNGKIFYLLQLCKEAYKIFSDGKYFLESYKVLEDILLEDNWKQDDQINIRTLSQCLIIELLLKGYSLKTIELMPKKIFDKYITIEGHLLTEFPISVKRENYIKNGKLDESSHNKAVEEEIDKLSIKDRLDAFIKYYRETPKEVYFIYEVEGLKGRADFYIGGVNFYSPDVKKYVKDDESLFKKERFEDNPGEYFINAAVKVNSIDIEASKLLACGKIELALDILRCYYQPETKYEVVQDGYIIVNDKGNVVGEGRSLTSRTQKYRWFKSLDITKYKESDIKELSEISSIIFSSYNNQDVTGQKIVSSLHWYRKAEETTNYEDKLLNYWIVIENFMEFKNKLNVGNILLNDKTKETKYSLIKELVPYFVISNYLYEVGRDLYWYLRNIYNSFYGTLKIRVLDLPDNVVKACNLNPPDGSIVRLEEFIGNLTLLIDHIDRKIIKDRIIFTKEFYTDKQFTKEQISKQIDDTKDDILLIYRLRNKIVHNAHYDNIILPYYVEKIRRYSSIVLRKVIYKHYKNKSLTIEEILMSQYVKTNCLLEKLSNNLNVDFFNLDI